MAKFLFEKKEKGWVLNRNTHPHWVLSCDDECIKEKLADSLNKAAEFLRKGV